MRVYSLAKTNPSELSHSLFYPSMPTNPSILLGYFAYVCSADWYIV